MAAGHIDASQTYGDWARAHPIRAVICVVILILLVPIALWGIGELVSLL